MHSNTNRRASGSNPHNGYSLDSGSASYPGQFPVNGMQWLPQSPGLPPFPSQMQNNAWMQQQPQQQQNVAPNQILNGMSVGHPVSMQQTPLFNNNLGLLPANILQDVFRLSVPVGSSPNDDSLLVQVLKDSTEKGQTYRQAIETLHGINNHAANLWKDHYLDHKARIDNLVSPQTGPSVKTVKKPSPYLPPPPVPPVRATSKDLNQAGSSSRVTETRRPSIKKERVSPKLFTSTTSRPAAPSKRHTINSITAYEPSLNLKLLPPQADIKLPDPPSQAPTPPTRVVRGGSGNRFTPEDKEFFIKFIHYELENDAGLTKHDLCVKLAEKVPSHSADSWKSYWSSSHELPDKIFAAYDRVSSDGGKASKVSAPVPIMKPRPNYADESDSESESSPGSSSDSISLSETASDFEALEDLLEADSNDEGESGGGYTATDMRNVVLHLAANPDEKESTLWSKFHEQHPQRSDKSWREYYRRNDKEINRYLRKLRKFRKRERTKKLPAQRGRPSWASNGPLPSALKRKVSSGGYDGKFKRKKDYMQNDSD